MKISFLENHLPINGSIRHIIDMPNELVRRGDYEAIIYSLDSECAWLECKAEIRLQKQVLEDSHEVLIFNSSDLNLRRLMRKAKADRKLFYLVGMLDGKDRKIIRDWLTGVKKSGGNRDFAVHNETALIMPVGDVEAMGEAIVELVEDREKAERLAKNALEKIREYTWEKSVDQLLEVLSEQDCTS